MLMLQLIAAGTALVATPPAEPQPQPQPAASPFGATVQLDEQALDTATAREDIAQIAASEQAATVSGNSANGTSTTGNIIVDGNAFQNLSGLAIVNSNSGNNVAINSAMNVNIIFTPQP